MRRPASHDYPPCAGEVYVSELVGKFRRVLLVRGDEVFYVTGTERTKRCRAKTMARWIKAAQAKLANRPAA